MLLHYETMDHETGIEIATGSLLEDLGEDGTYYNRSKKVTC